MKKIMNRLMNFTFLASREDEHILELIMNIAEMSGLSELEFFNESEETQDVMFSFISACCECIWHILNSDSSLERYLLYPCLFDSACRDKCLDHIGSSYNSFNTRFFFSLFF